MEDNKTTKMKDFVDRLTLGVTKVLESRPGVAEVRFMENEPAERHMIISWEQKNCCIIPEDLRNFYLMSDGFLMTWSIRFDGSVMELGSMVINSISKLTRLGAASVYSLPNAPTLADIEDDTDDEGTEGASEKPRFGSDSRIFELDSCNGNGKVCLIYKNVKSGAASVHAEIWFLDRALYWHFITSTFTAYYRLMVIHLGLPQWQYTFTKHGISPQAKQWFNMYKPLTFNTNVAVEEGETFVNKLDPGRAFKNKNKLQIPKKKAPVQPVTTHKSQTGQVTGRSTTQSGNITKK
ncbi:tubulin polyglutamylase complex subunit 2 [Callorhinchus milii]|uniref:Tubulin polyglutamylase complex subunit 2 n=1 Tax=Callorhinchus milii TaxID=7868 RepID=V9KZB7_CALMI|nr:tubulin polyglutamylase complex subunit 2 [Callorhinchus milii]|eukprot:gi/632958927/ref/XP_007895328.1/ PREDICTED: tubulin polyglutamylase complex subunit 2 [Callorhinchus milii]